MIRVLFLNSWSSRQFDEDYNLSSKVAPRHRIASKRYSNAETGQNQQEVLTSSAELDSDADIFDWSLPEFAQMLQGRINPRTVIVNEKGFIGHAFYLDVIRKRDLICVLLGCSVPMILRRVEDHYILIGDGYVEGIM
jgi:hypothetical protein